MENGRSKSPPSRIRVPKVWWPALWLMVALSTGGTWPMWQASYRDDDGQIKGRDDSLWTAIARGPGTDLSMFRSWDGPNLTRLALLLIFAVGPLASYPLWHPPAAPKGAADHDDCFMPPTD